jgi:hypothetical protein
MPGGCAVRSRKRTSVDQRAVRKRTQEVVGQDLLEAADVRVLHRTDVVLVERDQCGPIGRGIGFRFQRALLHDDRRVALDAREDRLARAFLPLVAAVEDVLRTLAVLQARKGARQVIRIGVVERRAVRDDRDSEAAQQGLRLLFEQSMEAIPRPRLQVVRADLDHAARLGFSRRARHRQSEQQRGERPFESQHA